MRWAWVWNNEKARRKIWSRGHRSSLSFIKPFSFLLKQVAEWWAWVPCCVVPHPYSHPHPLVWASVNERFEEFSDNLRKVKDCLVPLKCIQHFTPNLRTFLMPDWCGSNHVIFLQTNQLWGQIVTSAVDYGHVKMAGMGGRIDRFLEWEEGALLGGYNPLGIIHKVFLTIILFHLSLSLLGLENTSLPWFPRCIVIWPSPTNTDMSVSTSCFALRSGLAELPTCKSLDLTLSFMSLSLCMCCSPTRNTFLLICT